MKVMMCPSSPRAADRDFGGSNKWDVRWGLQTGRPIGNSGGNNLVGPGGLMSTQSPPVILPTPQNNGIMQTNVKTRITTITDGTSNTFLIAECAGNANLYREGRVVSPKVSRAYLGGPQRGHGPEPGYDPTKNASPGASTRPGLVMINGTNDSEVYAFHTGGANIVFADGHVSFVRSSISPYTFIALVTYQGGDLPGDY